MASGIKCIYCSKPLNSVVGLDRWHRECHLKHHGNEDEWKMALFFWCMVVVFFTIIGLYIYFKWFR